MAKKDIGKILTTGSLKQRLLLVAENNARTIYGKDKILTDSEYNQLSDSFKKPNEIKLWNQYLNYSKNISNAILNLQGLKYEVLMHYSNLRGYILVWDAIESSELLVNSVLHEVDKKDRKKISEHAVKDSLFLFSKPEPDEEGYIDIKVDFLRDSYRNERGEVIGYKENPRKTKEYSLLHIMSNVKNQAERTIKRYVSWERAIVDFMEEKGFNVATFKDIIKSMTAEVYSPIIGWGKYYGADNTGLNYPGVKEVIKKYDICPKVEDIEIDEAEYNWFKINILGDE